MRLKNRIYQIVILVILFFTILINSSYAVSGQNETHILIIYSLPEEKSILENILTNSTIQQTTFTSVSFENFTNISVTIDLLIVVSSINFIFTDSQQIALIKFLNMNSKSIIVFSPFLDVLDEELGLILGIDWVDELFPSETDNTEWNLYLNSSIGDLSAGTQSSYNGKFLLVKPLPGIEVIGSIIGSGSNNSDILELPYPLPFLLNFSSSNSLKLTSTISPISAFQPTIQKNVGITLNSHNDIFDVILFQLLNTALKFHENIKAETILESKNIVKSDLNNTNDVSEVERLNIKIDDFDLPTGFLKLQLLVLLGIVSLVLVFHRKILVIFNLLTEKLYTGLIFIISVFYNTEGRIVSENQLFLNKIRASIMEYLEYLTLYGGHLREIKSALNLSMSSLLWHIKILEDFGWVEKFKVNRYSVFVASEFAMDFDPQQKEIEYKLISKHSKKIIDTLITNNENDQLDLKSLMRITLVDRKTLKRILNALNEQELVEFSKRKSYRISIIDTNRLNELSKSFQLREEFKAINNE